MIIDVHYSPRMIGGIESLSGNGTASLPHIESAVLVLDQIANLLSEIFMIAGCHQESHLAIVEYLRYASDSGTDDWLGHRPSFYYSPREVRMNKRSDYDIASSEVFFDRRRKRDSHDCLLQIAACNCLLYQTAKVVAGMWRPFEPGYDGTGIRI